MSRRPGRCLALFVFGWLATTAAHAQEFAITGLETRLTNQVYVMDARVNYLFSATALEALSSGVPLTLRMDIEVQRKRRWLPDETIAALEQRYQLRYHALSHQYLVNNLNSGALYAFPTQESAIDSLGELRDFPLLDAKLIEAREKYEIVVRVLLDFESLPTPLRLIAYVTPSWYLASDWSSWSLTP